MRRRCGMQSPRSALSRGSITRASRLVGSACQRAERRLSRCGRQRSQTDGLGGMERVVERAAQRRDDAAASDRASWRREVGSRVELVRARSSRLTARGADAVREVVPRPRSESTRREVGSFGSSSDRFGRSCSDPSRFRLRSRRTLVRCHDRARVRGCHRVVGGRLESAVG